MSTIKRFNKDFINKTLSSEKKMYSTSDSTHNNNGSLDAYDMSFESATNYDNEESSIFFENSNNSIFEDIAEKTIRKAAYDNIMNKINDYSYSTITKEWWFEEAKALMQNDINLNDYCDNVQQRDIIVYYLKNVEDCSAYDDYSLRKKVSIARQAMLYDADHGYDILHSTPVLKEGKVDTGFCISSNSDMHYEYDGKYLQYYNENGINFIAPLAIIGADENGKACVDKEFSRSETFDYTITVSKYYTEIMHSNERYTDEFNNTISRHLKTVFMAQFDINDKQALSATSDGNGSWVAYAAENERGIFKSVDSNMTIDIGEVDSYRCGFDYMVDTYTHELAHVFANATGWHFDRADDIDLCREWLEVYDQLEPYTTAEGGKLLRPYAISNPHEAFAECIAEYFGGISSKNYNPNDLKAIDVTVNGRVRNLYDVMEYILRHEY